MEARIKNLQPILGDAWGPIRKYWAFPNAENREVIAKNPDNLAKFRSGNEGVFKFFVGQVMKATKGQGNPQAVNDVVRKLLTESN